jgi:uncharacterized protein YqjF (DUF2071 family)
MNLTSTAADPSGIRSRQARRRMLARRGERLFLADWADVWMFHYEVDPVWLRGAVPFELDLLNGRAIVSLVAFTMRDLRLFFGNRWTAWLCRPIATHEFLNVRTYVRHGAETGIYFMAEWLSNRLAVRLGPLTFGLPYRYAQIAYRRDQRAGVMRGRVSEHAGTLVFEARPEPALRFEPCENGSIDEWLMERNTACTGRQNGRGFFWVWHPPWRQCRVEVELLENSLLRRHWPWFTETQCIGGNHSPGLPGVWMGRPHRLTAGPP